MQILFSEKGQIFLSFELASTSINATGAWSYKSQIIMMHGNTI